MKNTNQTNKFNYQRFQKPCGSVTLSGFPMKENLCSNPFSPTCCKKKKKKSITRVLKRLIRSLCKIPRSLVQISYKTSSSRLQLSSQISYFHHNVLHTSYNLTLVCYIILFIFILNQTL